MIDAGVTEQLVDSDHRAVKCKLRVMLKLRKKTTARQKLLRLDFNSLSNEEVVGDFCQKVSESMQRATEEDKTYKKLSEAMTTAAVESVPKKKRLSPGWFNAAENTLKPLIDARNRALQEVHRNNTPDSVEHLKSCRKAVKSAISRAKNNWIEDQCSALNSSVQRGTKESWELISKLKSGLDRTQKLNTTQMKKSDGSLCTTPEENAEVFRSHFEGSPEYDESVLDLLQEIPVTASDATPSDEEIRKATTMLRNTAPGNSGIPAQLWKALLGREETFKLFVEVIKHFWVTEEVPEEWNTGLLKILPKKGDLKLPGNHRGIMMLEACYKVVAIITHSRLTPTLESLDHEPQCGFRSGRSTSDAVFTIKAALKKRKEHGLESWILFIDLVKAFDKVPRELLWKILLKYGVPPKIVRLLIKLHADFKVQFDVDGVTQQIKCTVGVKQGDILGPMLFNFFIAAVMSSWRTVYGGTLCLFRTEPDFTMTGRKHDAQGEEYALLDSEYADDTAILYGSRHDLVTETPIVISHFRRFGMEIHQGNRALKKDSKSEALFVAKPHQLYDNPDTYDDADLSDIDLGNGYSIPIVSVFVYLGSAVSRDCTDEEDVKMRIDAAGGAFAALRDKIFASKCITMKVKKFVYLALVLTILLYGSECWSLTEKLYNRLRAFHHRCIRSMCRVTRLHTRKHLISNAELLERTDLQPIDSYISKRQLRWAGHVARMPNDRLPRKMLSCWVNNKRPRGAPQMTYGRSLKKSLKKAKIPSTNWHELAQDRAKWRELINAA